MISNVQNKVCNEKNWCVINPDCSNTACRWTDGRAQQPAKLLQLGILTFDVPSSEPFLEVFFQELRRLGYVEGQNIAFEFRIPPNVLARADKVIK